MIGEAGWFVSPDYLSSYGTMPPAPWNFYVRVTYPIVNPTIEYISNVVTANLGGTGDWYFTSFNCHPLVLPCVPSPDFTFQAGPVGPQNQHTCLTLCPGHTTTIYVWVAQENRRPIVTVTPGCIDCGDPNCTAVQGFDYNPQGWTWVQDPTNRSGHWVNTLALPAGVAGGCVCVRFETLLPAEFGSFDAVAMDNSVKLNWNTRSETNVARFEVKRNGTVIATKDAANNASGATYDYVDNSAVNGTTYTYALVMVNMDGSRQELAIASATPSFGNAVVTEYALHQNFPNPFNPTTSIAFDLKEANTVSLTIFNATGQEVARLLNNVSYSKAGRYSMEFDAANLTSGLYFYTIKIGNEFSATKKMLLVK